MRFRLTIEMGNDAMQTPEDVAAALERVAGQIRGVAPADLGKRAVYDGNGNNVGAYGYTGRLPRKTRDSYEVRGNYGHGYECVTAEETLAGARGQLRTYRDNEPGVPFKIVKVREPIAAETSR